MHEIDEEHELAVQNFVRALGGETDRTFQQALADNILDPHPVMTDVFRHPRLAKRSLLATRYLIDQANASNLHPDPDEPQSKRRSRARFRNLVGAERRLLEELVAAERARLGLDISSAPSARGRALRRLKQRHLQEFQELTRQEEEKLLAEKISKRRAD